MTWCCILELCLTNRNDHEGIIHTSKVRRGDEHTLPFVARPRHANRMLMLMLIQPLMLDH
jgi:hypothetical protein